MQADPREDEARDWADVSAGQGTPQMASMAPEAREGQGGALPESQGTMTPPTPSNFQNWGQYISVV